MSACFQRWQTHCSPLLLVITLATRGMGEHLQQGKGTHERVCHDGHHAPAVYIMIQTDVSSASCLCLFQATGTKIGVWPLDTKEREWIWIWASWPACKYPCLLHWQRLFPWLSLKMSASPSLWMLQWPYIRRYCEWLPFKTTAVLGRLGLCPLSCKRKGGEGHRHSLS